MDWRLDAWSRERLSGLPLALAALGAGLVASFAPVLTGQRSFLHFDLVYEYLPVWKAVQDALRAGHAPWWLDGEWCGHPLLYHQEAPVFYPLTVPLLLTGLPVHRLADLFSLIHFLGAGLSAWGLLRLLTGSAAGALVSGLAWMLSTRTVLAAIWPTSVGVLAWLPAALAGFVLISRGQSVKGSALAAGALGMCLLLGRPQSVLGAAPLVGAVAIASILAAPGKRRAAFSVAGAAALALGLGAAYLAPAAALHGEMSRTAGLSPEERDVLALGRAPSEISKLWGSPPGRFEMWPEVYSYPGAATGLLALAGLAVGLRDPRRRLLALGLLAGGLLGLAFAFGDAGPYRWLSGLPVLSGFRAPIRYLSSTALATAIFAGIGASRLATTRFAAIGGSLAVLAVGVDLVVRARAAAPTAPEAVYRAVPELVPHLGSLPPDEAGFPARTFTMVRFPLSPELYGEGAAAFVRANEPLAMARGMAFGLEGVLGAGPSLKRVQDLMEVVTPSVVRIAASRRVILEEPTPVLRQDEAAPPRYFVGTLPSPLPRAFAVPKAIPVEAGAAIGPVRAGFPAHETAFVEGVTEPIQTVPWNEEAATVRLLRRTPGRLELTASLPGDGLLVLLESYERGWRANVDGRDATVFPTNHAFRGVFVPAGTHRVSFTYHPPGLLRGALLYAAGLLCVGALLRYSSSSED